MLRPYRVATAAVALLSLFGLATGTLRAEDTPTGDAGNGRRLYLAIGCFECHGRQGEGGAFNGPAPILAQIAVPFEAFKMQLREPVNDMPAYAEAVVPDKQVADLYAYVESLPGPQPLRDIPLLNN